MADHLKLSDDEKLFNAVFKFDAKLLGLVFGIVMGTGIFIATNWIVIQGGHVNPGGEHVVGPNLQLLSQFFIGYKVSFFGSIIGFGYGFAVGTLAGASIGWIYDKIVDFRN